MPKLLEMMQNITMQITVEMQKSARSNVQKVVEMAHTMQAKAHPFRRGVSD